MLEQLEWKCAEIFRASTDLVSCAFDDSHLQLEEYMPNATTEMKPVIERLLK
jgi:hypothetical protein